MYFLERITQTHDLEMPVVIFKDTVGIFTAKPFIADGKTIEYSYVDDHSHFPYRLNEVSATDCHATAFFEALSASGSPHNKWGTIKYMFENLPILFDYVSDQYDEYESEKTNQRFDRKMYDVTFLDKNLNLDFIYVKEDVEILSIRKS